MEPYEIFDPNDYDNVSVFTYALERVLAAGSHSRLIVFFPSAHELHGFRRMLYPNIVKKEGCRQMVVTSSEFI
jgi:hypothetical protein